MDSVIAVEGHPVIYRRTVVIALQHCVTGLILNLGHDSRRIVTTADIAGYHIGVNHQATIFIAPHMLRSHIYLDIGASDVAVGSIPGISLMAVRRLLCNSLALFNRSEKCCALGRFINLPAVIATLYRNGTAQRTVEAAGPACRCRAPLQAPSPNRSQPAPKALPCNHHQW